MDRLEAIRRLYFTATPATIARDFDRAIDLLKAMPSEQERQRATVFMEGLAQMRKEWNATRAPAASRPTGASSATRRRRRSAAR